MKYRVIFLSLLVGCGGGDDPGPRGGPAAKGRLTQVATTPPAEDAEGAGRIVGRAVLDGPVPVARPMSEVEATAGCLAEGHDVPLDDRRLVSEDGGIANVVVRLLRAPQAPPPPTEPLIVDQVGCVFVPHVAVLQAGRPVAVKNSDGIVHNARVSALKNRTANISLGPKAAPTPLPLEEAEFCKLSCDLHPWMTAHVVVLEHPWFGLSGTDGGFVIEGVPPGTYGLEAWHEHYGRLKLRDVTVPEGGQAEVLATFVPKR